MAVNCHLRFDGRYCTSGRFAAVAVFFFFGSRELCSTSHLWLLTVEKSLHQSKNEACRATSYIGDKRREHWELTGAVEKHCCVFKKLTGAVDNGKAAEVYDVKEHISV